MTYKDNIQYKIDENINPEIIEYDPYAIYDKECAKLNKIKALLLQKSSLAKMGCIVKSSKERPIIGTMALDTCYGIMFYDRDKKYGIVGHGSSSGKISTLHSMLQTINDGTEKTIEYMIVPGYRNVDYHNYEGLDELQRELIENCPQNIKLIPLSTPSQIRLHNPTLSYEFAFDTNSGEFVTDYLFFEESEVNPRYIPKSSR